MTGTIYHLPGVQTPESEAEHTDKTVELISHLMDRARRGEIRSLQITAITKAGDTIAATAVISKADLERLIGALTVQLHELSGVVKE